MEGNRKSCRRTNTEQESTDYRFPTENSDLPTPGPDVCYEEVFDFPYLTDDETVDYLKRHGRVMFIARGPPGTGKNVLSYMIGEKYPNSEICSAQDYFDLPCAPPRNNRKVINDSHRYCEEKARKACQQNKHVVINNCNVEKWETESLRKLAVEFCYTVIFAITLRKLSANPEALEKSNRRGLSKKYFQRRLNEWEEIVPQYTGWMLSPADTKYIMTECEKCFMPLMEIEDFSKVFCIQPEDNPKDFFTPDYFPFCLATYCSNGTNDATKNYYLSKKVQDAYGKVFPLVIQAFVITKSFIAAVVHLEENMKNLVLNNEVDASGLSDVLGAMSMNGGIKPKQPVTEFAKSSLMTATSCSRSEDEKIDTKNCSFIILSTAINDSSKYLYIKDVREFSDIIFSDVTDSDGNISATLFHTFSSNYKYCRLLHDSWLILSPEKIALKSVFTGIYTV